MKLFSVVAVATIVLCNLTPAISWAGKEGGGGGLTVENGQLVPADLEYVAHDHIPTSYRPVDFKKYPKAIASLQLAMEALKKRARGAKLFSEWDLKHTEFYFVPKLSGVDLESLSPGHKELQMAYTYEIPDLSGAGKPTRDIVEILKPVFMKERPRYQGLSLLHELMHHKPYGQHRVISPVIRDLNVVLNIKRRQDEGFRGLLSKKDIAALQELQTILGAIAHVPQGMIDPLGGGVIVDSVYDTSDYGNHGNWLNNPTLTQNYIDVYSWVELSEMASNFVMTDNTFVNSDVKISGRLIEGNTFINSYLGHDMVPNLATKIDNAYRDRNYLFPDMLNYEKGRFCCSSTAFLNNRFENSVISVFAVGNAGGYKKSETTTLQGSTFKNLIMANLTIGAEASGISKDISVENVQYINSIILGSHVRISDAKVIGLKKYELAVFNPWLNVGSNSDLEAIKLVKGWMGMPTGIEAKNNVKLNDVTLAGRVTLNAGAAATGVNISATGHAPDNNVYSLISCALLPAGANVQSTTIPSVVGGQNCSDYWKAK